MKKHILVALAVVVGLSGSAQTFINGGFEYPGYPDSPANWRAGAGEIKLDSIVKYCGKYAARITSGESPLGHYALAAINLPGNLAENKNIEVRAKLKREMADTVKTAIFIQKLTADDNISPPHYGDWFAGSGDWEGTSLKMVVEPPVNLVAIGVITSGQGTVWLDDVEVYADGKLLDYTPRSAPLTESEANWLTENTYSIYPEPDSRIGDFIGDPRIVGLGEITHGAADIGRANWQLAKYLIEEKGVTIIAMESMADLRLEDMNKYVLQSEDNRTKEAKDLDALDDMTEFLEWLVDYNLKTGRGVRFMGTENDDISSILDQVNILRGDWLWEPTATLRRIITPVNSDLVFFESPTFSQEQKDKIFAALAICREWARQNITDPTDLDLMMHNLELIEYYTDHSQSKRDPLMADNIEWITRRYPDEKIIFWAHNFHTGYIRPKENGLYINGSAGYHLRRKFGDDYYTIGTCFYEGSYGAFIPESVDGKMVFPRKIFPAQPAHPGSYEYLFNSIDKPDFFLPLRGFRVNDNNMWLVGTMEFRSIGAMHDPYGFSSTTLLDRFDAVVFIHETGPTKRSE